MESHELNGIQMRNQEVIVSRAEWLTARRQHLEKEKEFTRLRDQLAAERRRLPWVKMDKPYIFEGPEGKETLSELFDGRSQLIIRHFMFGPGWKEGCVGCSFAADHIDGTLLHLEYHDVSFVAVSRAPLAEIEAFKKRMGWKFKWVSSGGNDFNFDFNVSVRKEDMATGKQFYNYEMQEIREEELPGTSVFYKYETGEVFHTYSTFGRGEDLLVGTYNYLDLTPKGRNENGPNFNLMDWVKHHDRYADGSVAEKATGLRDTDSCCASKENHS